MSIPALRTRKPTGRVPWPLILLEGGEKSGKSWAAATLSASPRVDRTFWIDLGEGAGDEYGAIPGVRYEIVEHDGTWPQIIGAVVAIRDIARQAADAGEPPVVLVIDSMTALWDMLKDWATNRAKSTDSNRKKLRIDPNAEIVVSPNFWNDANARHRRLMTILMTFPGIAVVTARGKEVAEIDKGGKPTGDKGYRVEGHKDLAYDATVWVRMSRDDHPQIIGARSVHAGIQPGSDRARKVPGLELERLVFDILKCNPGDAHVRDLAPLRPGDAGPDGEPTMAARPISGPPVQRPVSGPPQDRPVSAPPSAPDPTDVRDWALQKDRTADGVRKAAARIAGTATAAAEVTNEHGDREQLGALLDRRVRELTPVPAVEEKRRRTRMHALWGELGLGGTTHRDARLQDAARIVGRKIATTNDLVWPDEVEAVIGALEQAQRQARKAAA